MDSKRWIRKAFTLCMIYAVVATSSMVALAGGGKPAGELIVTGGAAATVTVNGEAAISGRTIFSSSTISTTEGSGAILRLGKAGKIELGPKTTFALSFDDAAISGELASGTITVLNSSEGVSIKTVSGNKLVLNAGDKASADSESAANQASQNKSYLTGTQKTVIVLLIAGGIIGGIIWATRDDDVVSPTR